MWYIRKSTLYQGLIKCKVKIYFFNCFWNIKICEFLENFEGGNNTDSGSKIRV